MTVGLIAALPAEIRCLSRQVENTHDPVPISPHLVAMVCGMGAERAYQAAQSLLKTNIRALISWGTACALNPELRPGDLILPDVVFSNDGQRYTPDHEWQLRVRKSLVQAALPVHTGPLAEASNRLGSAVEKSELCKRTGAIAADMETAAIMKVAHTARLPCIAIRSIVDAAEMDLPAAVLDRIDDYGRPDWWPFLIETVCRPSQIPRLIRLAQAMQSATASLAAVARAAVDALLYPARKNTGP